MDETRCRIPPGRNVWIGLCLTIFAALAAEAAAWQTGLPPTFPDSEEGQVSSAQAAGKNVSDVRIEGNRTVSESKIFQQLQTRPGLPFAPEVAADDVRRLVSQLKLVSVRTVLSDGDDGVVVTYRVVERPTLEKVMYIGNDNIRTKTLAKETELEEGSTYDMAEILEGKRKIEDAYRAKGFNHVQVKIHEGNSPEHRKAIYVIQEGPKQVVDEVDFVGNRIASAGRLRTLLKTKTPMLFFFGGKFKPNDLDADVDRLVAYYHGLGFWDVRVGREVSFDEEQQKVKVTFVIDEGARFTLRNVTVVGNRKFQTDDILAETELKQGAFFQQTTLQADLQKLKDYYGSRGYVFADVQAEPRYLEDPGRMDLVYKVEEGSRYRVGKIEVQIEGDNPHTKITAVLNRMSLRPGDVVDIREMRDSERRLKASGLFRSDPARNIAPKISFAPPELDGSGSVLAGRGGGARAQSPDQPTYVWTRPAGTIAPDDAIPLDLRFLGELTPEPTAPAATGQNVDSGGYRPQSRYGGQVGAELGLRLRSERNDLFENSEEPGIRFYFDEQTERGR